MMLVSHCIVVALQYTKETLLLNSMIFEMPLLIHDLCSPELRRRIELIQDFEMPISSSHIQVPIIAILAAYDPYITS